MNLLSGFGNSSAKSLVIRFIADTARASKDIDKLSNKINKVGPYKGISSLKGASNLNRWKMDNFNIDTRTQFGKNLKAYSGVTDMDRKMSSYLRGSKKLEENMKAVGNEARNSTSFLSKFSGKLGIATIAIAGFIAVMSKVFSMGTMVENSLTSLEVLQGSSKKARETMKLAMDFSLRTPFKPREVLGATQAAAQYHIDLYKKGKYGLGKDQNVAQILAGMGSFVDLSGEKIGMGRATHAVMRGDYRLLRQYRGLVNPAFEAAKGKGKVGTPAFTREFIKGLGKIPQIMDMAKKQSETVAGLWSTIAGSMDIVLMKFSGAGEESGVVTMWSHVRDILFEVREGILNLVDYIGPGLTDIGAAIGSFFKMIWKIAKVVGVIIAPTFKIIWFIIRAIAVVLEWVFSKIGKILDFFVKIYDKINDVTKAADEFNKKENEPGLLEDAIAFLKAQLMLADVMFDWAMAAMWERIAFLIDAFKRLIKVFASGGNIVDFVKGEGTFFHQKAVASRQEEERKLNEGFIKGYATEAQKRIINAPKTPFEKNLIKNKDATDESIRQRRITVEREKTQINIINNSHYLKAVEQITDYQPDPVRSR